MYRLMLETKYTGKGAVKNDKQALCQDQRVTESIELNEGGRG